MPAAHKSRQEVIEGLLHAIRHSGYEGASVSKLEETTGLKRASLYHHFPGGKTDMAHAVLEAAGARFNEQVLGPLRAEGVPEERLRLSAAGVAHFYSNGSSACLLELFSVCEVSGPVAEEVSSGFERWLSALSEVLVAGGMSGERARERAADLVSRIQGALILARATGKNAPFQRAVDALANALDTRGIQ